MDLFKIAGAISLLIHLASPAQPEPTPAEHFTNIVAQVEQPKPKPKKADCRKERTCTVKDNPNKCNLSTHWMWPDGSCHKKTAPQPTTNTTHAVTGNRETWLRAVGIPESEWWAVDSVINGEGGWNGVTRWNTGGSGAYGICQSLPASKMASAGSDYMTNGLTQLKWCNNYALERYGSWSYAAQWKQCVGYCTNSFKPSYSTYKDHTWW